MLSNNISHIIEDLRDFINLQFIHITKIHIEGTISQVSNLGLSF